MSRQGREAPAPNGGLGEKLFSFVVYADSHVNQSETESMSPHQVNKLANGRHRHVIDEINRIAPAFAIHLGDLVHPVPVMELYADAAQRFHEQVAEIRCPLHIIPGNHDIGDKLIRWGPAEPVSNRSLALWEQHFGPHYHAFEQDGCRFLLLNAQIVNSGLAAEAEQRAWFEEELDAHAGKRLFVGIHYPPFVLRPDELEYYDNIAEPGRSWLLKLVAENRVEAMFSGHVHNFWYHRIGATDFYILPSITFVRHDYSEMYRVRPGKEAGRNDAVKLGYLVVDVYERGHLAHPVRTYGQGRGPGEPAVAANVALHRAHPKVNARANFGFDLRQPWAEIVEIPPSGGLDEFARKIVRNDYPLLALWETGTRNLRIPFQDLLDARVRERMRDLKRIGMDFSIFSYGRPSDDLVTALDACGDLVSAWEIALPPEDIRLPYDRLPRPTAECAIYLSRLRSKEDMETDGQRYYHVINHGFVAGERDEIAALLDDAALRDAVGGFVFRIPRERPCWDEIVAIGTLAAELDTGASVHVRLATSNPASEACDDVANANRIAEALAASLTQPHIRVYLDTFADVDRGYFVRTGVVDRRFNPRLGLQVVRHLYGHFGARSDEIAALGQRDGPHARTVALRQGGVTHALVQPTGDEALFSLPSNALPSSATPEALLKDLATGESRQTGLALEANGDIRLAQGSPPPNPFIVSFPD